MAPKVPNPCCMPLQKGVKIMAIIDVVLDSLNVISVALAISYFVNEKDENNRNPFYTHDKITSENKELDIGIWSLALTMLTSIMGFLLSLRLYIGAKRKELKNIKKWLIVTTIILTITIILHIINGSSGRTDYFNISSTTVSVLYRLYMMWVVYAFVQELQAEGIEE